MYSALFQVASNTKERKLSSVNVESKIIFFSEQNMILNWRIISAQVYMDH